MELNNVLDDGQPKPDPLEPAAGAAVGLSEPLKDMRKKLRSETHAVVDDPQPHGLAVAEQADCHPSTVRCELHRVGEQVPHYLPYAVAVAQDIAGVRLQVSSQNDALGIDSGTHRSDRIGDQSEQVALADIQFYIAADDVRDIEDVLDHFDLRRERCA